MKTVTLRVVHTLGAGQDQYAQRPKDTVNFSHHPPDIVLSALTGEFVQQSKTIKAFKGRIPKRQLTSVRLNPIHFVLPRSFRDAQPGPGEVHSHDEKALFNEVGGIPPGAAPQIENDTLVSLDKDLGRVASAVGGRG